MRSVLNTLTLLVLVGALLSAAGQQEAAETAPVQIEFMWESGETQPYERDILDKLITDFQYAYPTIQLKNNPFIGDAEDYQAKLLSRLKTGEGPDMFTVGDNTLFRYAKTGYAATVPTQFATTLKGRFPSALKDGMDKVLSWEGKLHGVPWNADWVSLWYNKDMFREAGLDPSDPPVNLEELREYAVKLTVRDNGRVSRSGISLRGHKGGAGTADKWINFLTAKGGRLFDEQMSKTLVNNRAGVAAVQYYLDLLYTDNVDLLELEPRDSNGFAQQKTAMFGRGPWVMSFLEEAAPDLNYAVGVFPGKSIPFVDGLCVSSGSEKKDSAWTFLEWLMEGKNFGRWQTVLNSIPLLKEVADLKYFKENEVLSAFINQPLFEVPQHEKLYEMKSILGDYLEKACYRQMPVQEAMDAAADEINAILQE